MTADEVLKQMQIAAVMQADNPVCVIDAQSRTITVPEQYKLFGVENDKRETIKICLRIISFLLITKMQTVIQMHTALMI